MKQSIGLTILKNLGLTDAEAEILDKQRPEKINTVYARDQSGLGYRKQTTNYIADANDIFARLSAKVAGANHAKNISIAPGTGFQTKRFIPSRLKKRSIGSLSNEDLATIFNEPEEPSGAPIAAITPQKTESKHRHQEEQANEEEAPKIKHRHHKSEVSEEQQEAPVSEEAPRKHRHHHHRSAEEQN